MKSCSFNRATSAETTFFRLPVLALLMLAVLLIRNGPALAEGMETYETQEASYFYEPQMKGPIREIAGLYPAVRKELELTLGLPVDFKPAVILVSDEVAFEQIVGNRLIVAYAVPGKMLMVIDYARSSKDPFSTRTILKHELCHLLLHRHIGSLPRWLDEGVSQWASGGFAELLLENRGSSLRWATISGSLMSLSSLEKEFPRDEPGLVLAYEQSRSIVEYIAHRYGKNGITNILNVLKNGTPPAQAVAISLGTDLVVLEKDWQQSIRTFSTLLALVVANIYSVIFFAAALATVAGYARYRLRKRRLAEESELYPDNT